MTPYKGIIRIECKRIKGGCLRNLRENVKPGCIDCPEAMTQVLDLEDKVIYEYRSSAEDTGKSVAHGAKRIAKERKD